MLKLIATETFQEIADRVIETAGDEGQLSGEILAPFYKAMPSNIYGGSSEIQRNILAKSVLNLPS